MNAPKECLIVAVMVVVMMVMMWVVRMMRGHIAIGTRSEPDDHRLRFNERQSKRLPERVGEANDVLPHLSAMARTTCRYRNWVRASLVDHYFRLPRFDNVHAVIGCLGRTVHEELGRCPLTVCDDYDTHWAGQGILGCTIMCWLPLQCW
jgi:hypothetical protein